MIKILNHKLNVSIQMDETKDWITLIPKDYEDQPSVTIELVNFDLYKHSGLCKECRAFINAFGTDTFDWVICYLDKKERLDLSKIGKEYGQSKIQLVQSDLFTGTKLTLMINIELPLDQEALEAILKVQEEMENYERCALVKKLIDSGISQN